MCFRELTAEDQIALLKSSAIEIIMLRSNQSFSLEDMSWSCGGPDFKYCINDVTKGWFGFSVFAPTGKLQIFYFNTQRMFLTPTLAGYAHSVSETLLTNDTHRLIAIYTLRMKFPLKTHPPAQHDGKTHTHSQETDDTAVILFLYLPT